MQAASSWRAARPRAFFGASYSAEVKNAWGFPPFPLYTFVASSGSVKLCFYLSLDGDLALEVPGQQRTLVS